MPNVLITGAGRGIGRAATLRLAAAGWNVYAGVRNDSDGAALADQAATVHPVRLDITSAGDIAGLDPQLPASLDGVVNNAGISVGGPIEALPLDELRRQFEVNLFGQVAVTQVVLPRLRTSGGRIVFVSSLSGRVATAPWHRALYAKHIEGFRKTIPLSQRMASDPDGVAAAIERALTAKRPRARYVVGAAPKAQSVLVGLTPTLVLDATLAKLGGVPRPP